MDKAPYPSASRDAVLAELKLARERLRVEEAEWVLSREMHRPLVSHSRQDDLKSLRDRVFFLKAKLARFTR